MGVPINEDEAVDRWWAHAREGYDDVPQALLRVLYRAVTNDEYVLSLKQIAARVARERDVADEYDEPEDYYNALQESGAIDWLEDAGALSKETALWYDGTIESFSLAQNPVLLEESVLEVLYDHFIGTPSPLKGRARDIAVYLGSAMLAERPLDPREAWLYHAVNKHATIVEPDIRILHAGSPDEDNELLEAKTPFEFLYGGIGDVYAEYVLLVEIESQTGQFEIPQPEFLAQALDEEIIDLHTAALYNDYRGDFAQDAAETYIEEEAKGQEREGPIPSEWLPRYIVEIVMPSEIGCLRIASLFQKEQSETP